MIGKYWKNGRNGMMRAPDFRLAVKTVSFANTTNYFYDFGTRWRYRRYGILTSPKNTFKYANSASLSSQKLK